MQELNMVSIKKNAAVVFILFVILLVIYGNSFHCEWHYDDIQNILQNNNVHLQKITLPDIKNTFYYNGKIIRPVSYFTFAVNYYVGKLNPTGYHIVNFLIHYITSIFLFLLIFNTLNLPLLRKRYKEDSYKIAFLATLLWSINPVQVLAVTYIVQRMASMAGMFYVMAMYFYLKGRLAGNIQKRIIFTSACLLSALLAFGTKQNAIMLVVILYIFDLFLIQGLYKENIKWNLKFVLIPLSVFVVCALLLIDVSSLRNFWDLYSIRPFTPIERLLTEPRVIIFYVSLLLYPVNARLGMVHDIDISRSFFQPPTTAISLLMIILLIGWSIYASRKRPLISFCILFFFLNHLIEGSILPLELIYEHRNYIPSMFFFIPVAIFVIELIRFFSYKKIVQYAVITGLGFFLILQGHAVYSYNKVLNSEYTLWFDSVEKAPNVSRSHSNLGRAYMNQGLLEDAIREFHEALRLKKFSLVTDEAIPEHNLGEVYFFQKEDELALEHYKKAQAINPRLPFPLIGIAKVKMRKGDFENAYKYVSKSLEINSTIPESHEYMSIILFKLNRLEEAFQEAQITLQLNQDKIIPLIIMAEVFRMKDETHRAIQCWREVLQKAPYNIRAHFALIELYPIIGKEKLLGELIQQIDIVRDGKRLEDFIDECMEGENFLVYVPNKDTILSIIDKQKRS